MGLIKPAHIVTSKQYGHVVCSDGTRSEPCRTKIELALEANRLREAGKILDEEISYLAELIDACGLPVWGKNSEAFGSCENLDDVRDVIIALFGDDDGDIDMSEKRPSSLGSDTLQ